MRFCEKLERWMVESRMSGEVLAPLLGVSTMTVSRWRKGKIEPRRDELERLARAMRVPLGWLADDAQDELPQEDPDRAHLERIIAELGPAEAIRRLVKPQATTENPPATPGTTYIRGRAGEIPHEPRKKPG
jgi:transcriptional regulator with XRE-family HTH domain